MSIGTTAAVRAELVRTRGSASARFALVGLILCLLQGLGWWLVATSSAPDWFGLFGWQSMYATGLLAPLVGLLVGMTVSREAKARDGGTWARPLAPRTAILARFLVITGQLGLFHLAITAPLLGFGLLQGLDEPPFGRFVTLWLVLWGASLLPAAVSFVLARRIGMLATIGLMVVWQVAGTVLAESSIWWTQPWAWPVRAVLPVLGIHANAVRLEAGSPLWLSNPWLPTLAAVLVAGLCIGALALTAGGASAGRGGRPKRQQRREAAHVVSTPVSQPVADHEVMQGRRRPVAAHLQVLAGTAVWPLVALTIVVFAVVALVWNGAYVAGLATWLVIPIGCAVLAVLAWTAHESAWPVAVLRTRPAVLGASLGLVCGVILTVIVAAIGGGLWLSGGAGPAEPIRFLTLLWLVGLATLMVDLWLVTRFGTAATLGVTLVGLVISLVFGGSWLAEGTTWLVGWFGWPHSATTWPRALLAGTASAVVAAAAGLGWWRALRRAAAR
ncbi:hypothetical protein [Enemella sp. A6]|uniref:hypothetical protein n=1 Tax=Enemella sp. A6 TaxID=3440152 RepID=UPI003EB6DBE8